MSQGSPRHSGETHKAAVIRSGFNTGLRKLRSLLCTQNLANQAERPTRIARHCGTRNDTTVVEENGPSASDKMGLMFSLSAYKFHDVLILSLVEYWDPIALTILNVKHICLVGGNCQPSVL